MAGPKVARGVTMSDAVIFAVAFVGFFVLRAIAATVIFFFILPAGDRCPMCDARTFRIQSRGWNLLMPWFRTSWCAACGWEGLLRRERRSPSAIADKVTSSQAHKH
jgi:hypothetical protein